METRQEKSGYGIVSSRLVHSWSLCSMSTEAVRAPIDVLNTHGIRSRTPGVTNTQNDNG